MIVSGKFPVKAPVQKVWNSFWHPDTMAIWVPGCTSAALDGNKIKATVEQSVAFLKARFDMEMQIVERDEPYRVVAVGEGKDPRIASQVKVTMTLDLAPSGESTDVSYSAEVQVYGRVATIGHFVMQAKVKDLEKEFTQRVKGALE